MAVAIHNAETHREPGSGSFEPDRTFNWANHGLSSNNIDHGIQPLLSLTSPAASLAASLAVSLADEHRKLERKQLQSARVESFLVDEDYPYVIGANVLLRKERIERALAEVDGIMAGFQFLGKIERYGAPNTGGADLTQSDGVLHGFGQWQDCGDHEHNQPTPPPKTAALPVSLPPRSTAHSKPDERSHNAPNNKTQKPNSPAQPTRADDKAWRGLWSLKAGMESEFQRFNEVAIQSTPSTLRQLQAQFPNSKALADRGILVYRDVLEGPLPDTLADVFAFASVSHAVSEILVGRKRMQQADVLSGLTRWRNCIQNAEERNLFDVLALKMWPRSCASLLQREGSSESPPFPGYQSPLDPEEEPGSSEFSARAASADTNCFPANPSDTGQFRMLPADLEQYVIDMTTWTEQEFNFSLLRDLVSDSIDMDSTELSFDHHQPIPGFSPPPALTLAADHPPAPATLPLRSQTPSPVQFSGALIHQPGHVRVPDHRQSVRLPSHEPAQYRHLSGRFRVR